MTRTRTGPSALVHRGPALLVAVLIVGLLASCTRDGPDTLVKAQRLTNLSTVTALGLPGPVVPVETDTVVLWLGPDLARRDARDGTFLVDPRRGVLTFVDHAARTWTTQTTEQIQRQLAALAAEAPGLDPSDERLALLQDMLTVAVKVTDTGEETRLDGYQCRRWILEQQLGEQLVTTELWLSEDIEVDFHLLHHATRPALLALPGGQAALAELSRLQGVTVLATALMRVQQHQGRSETRLLAVDEVMVPRSFFAPPAAYDQVHDPSP
jgi:hypothetical protein